MDETLTKHGPDPFGDMRDQGPAPQAPRLVLAWSFEEPGRVGEVLTPHGAGEGGVYVFGRESGIDFGRTGDVGHLVLARDRPPRVTPTGPADAPRVSRRQLRVRQVGQGRLQVENVGRCPLLVNGQEVTQTIVGPGDVLELKSQLLFLCALRPLGHKPLSPGTGYPPFPFGYADPYGLVGESPEAWALRRRILFLSKADAHLLVRGPSGSGKELVSQAIHQLSPRGVRRLVSRNAATVPEGLVDVEFFGNVQGFPNPGMAERPGLVGAANRSTLLLDELGELPQELQAHLLRVLDSGEYQRLGSAEVKRSDLRLIGLTNRAESELKHDLLARMKLRLVVPGLGERKGDIPLLTRHILKRLSQEMPDTLAPFFTEPGPMGEPRLTPGLMTFLLRRQYRHNIRELEQLLYDAIEHSHGPFISPGPLLTKAKAPEVSAAGEVMPSVEDIKAAIRAAGTGRDAAKRLGVSYRQLIYLLKKEGLTIRTLSWSDDT